jgi:hypothetical protein
MLLVPGEAWSAFICDKKLWIFTDSRQALEKWTATGEIELPAARDAGGDDQLASERGKSRFWASRSTHRSHSNAPVRRGIPLSALSILGISWVVTIHVMFGRK